MAVLAFERCAIHSSREAVCRCPVCSRYYCRECVTEHDEQMVCSACLARIGTARPATKRGRRFAAALYTTGGFALAGLVFYGAGQFLALVLGSR